jgi:hypothetical protein
VLILPETGALRPKTLEAIRAYVRNGGSLVASYDSTLSEGRFGLGDVFGVRYESILPHTGLYLELDDYAGGVPTPFVNAYSDALAVSTEGASAKARIVIPIAEWAEAHNKARRHGPPETKLDLPGITYATYGEGRVVYIASPLFTRYYAVNYHVHRTILSNIVTSLQPHRVLNAEAPATVEVNAMQTVDATFVHVLNYHADHGGGTLPRISDWPPTMDVKVQVYSPKRGRVSSVSGVKVEAQRRSEFVEIVLRGIRTHEVVKLT